MSVLDAFEDRVEELIDAALTADAGFLQDLMAVRVDLAAIRRAAYPQREVLDLLRHSVSPLIGGAGRRRFSDVFDVASRATVGLDAARTALAEILDAYRGAEARQSTDVTKVLTIYAAIMLPLSVVAGFFGMNFTNLPGIGNDWGWVIVTAFMVLIAALSLGIFVALGWIRRPSGREAGAALGQGLIEAARAPAQVVGAVYEMSTMPLRAAARLTRGQQDRGGDR
jgi:magnesium transporter